MKTVIDQMNRTLSVPASPMRIVSLVPSQTELLFDLGLGDRVVGITKFCVHPKVWFDHSSPQAKKRVGGTKTVNFKTIEKLQPDLIIGNKEENTESDILTLSQLYPTWMSDIYTLEDSLNMIEAIGKLTQTESKAIEIISHINSGLTSLKPPNKSLTCIYLIWNDPIMAVGQQTFINDIIDKISLKNIVKMDRYPVLTADELRDLQPDLLLLSSEPFPFKANHIAGFQQLLPSANIQIVDGEFFSWYGSRLQHSFDYFSKLSFLQ
jgi:ABC-type Fe3+-hydroxamate transport system substrate-binding protein